MVGGDEAGFIAVASCEVLRHDYGHLMCRVADKHYFGVIVGKVTVAYGLLDERPENKSLIRGLEVQDYLE